MDILNWAKDKRDHLVYSFAICTGLCLALSFLKSAPLIAILLTVSVGVYKEIRDMRSPEGKAELKDLIADGVGIILAVVLFLFSRLIS